MGLVHESERVLVLQLALNPRRSELHAADLLPLLLAFNPLDGLQYFGHFIIALLVVKGCKVPESPHLLLFLLLYLLNSLVVLLLEVLGPADRLLFSVYGHLLLSLV